MTKKRDQQPAPRKTPKSIVRIDSPDDAEIFDTGDVADFAGTSHDQPWYNSIEPADDSEEPHRRESGSTKPRRKDDASRPR